MKIEITAEAGCEDIGRALSSALKGEDARPLALREAEAKRDAAAAASRAADAAFEVNPNDETSAASDAAWDALCAAQRAFEALGGER